MSGEVRRFEVCETQTLATKKSHLKEMTFFAQIMKKLLLKIIKQCYLLF